MQWQKRENSEMLNDALFTALTQDKVDFAQLLIDNGVDLRRFLTKLRLRDLYAEVRATQPTSAVVRFLLMLLLEQST